MEAVEIVDGENADFVEIIELTYKHEGWLMAADEYELLEDCFGHELRFKIAKTKDGELVGSCMLIPFADVPFVALYFVMPQFRRNGIGKRLLDGALGDSLVRFNVGLHAEVKVSPIYDSCYGFNKYACWTSDQLEITNMDFTKFEATEPNLHVKDISEVSVDSICHYDAGIAKTERSDFLKKVVLKNCVCKILTDKAGKIVGYGRVRLTIIESPLLGPIYSDTIDGFTILFRELMLCCSEELKKQVPCSIRIPSVNIAPITKVLESVGEVKKISHCVPQFSQFVPESDMDRIYALIDLNIFV